MVEKMFLSSEKKANDDRKTIFVKNRKSNKHSAMKLLRKK